MKRLIVPIIAFLACFAIGGGAGAMIMKPGQVEADSLQADSTAADPTQGTTGDSAHAATDTAHATPDSSSHGTATETPHVVENDSIAANAAAPSASHAAPRATPESTRPAGARPADTNAAPASVPAPNTIASLVRSGSGATVSLRPDGTIGRDTGAAPAGPDFVRLARLLSKMGAREAAKTLEQLPPDQAARALSNMADKSAAAVLAQLAPDKAAGLLQAAIALVPKSATP